MIIDMLPTGDELHRYQRCLVVPFSGKRRVMSTSMHNGGYREDLTAVFNQDVHPNPGMPYEYCEWGEEKRRSFVTDKLGLDYDSVADMATIVSMENAAIETAAYDEITVTAVATASLEVNGGRVGEKTTSYEKHGKSIDLQPGTINIMVAANADMTPGCLARVIVTATEAKTAAIQELMAGSLQSSGIATGSGTDNMMVIANAESDNLLTYAGKHGKLGELIGVTVMRGVKRALKQHMGLTQESQHTMLARLKRFGVARNRFEEKFDETAAGNGLPAAAFADRIHKINLNGAIVAMTSLYVHLLDQLHWVLITTQEACAAGEAILSEIAETLQCAWKREITAIDNKEDCIGKMLERFVSVICTGAL